MTHFYFKQKSITSVSSNANSPRLLFHNITQSSYFLFTLSSNANLTWCILDINPLRSVLGDTNESINFKFCILSLRAMIFRNTSFCTKSTWCCTSKFDILFNFNQMTTKNLLCLDAKLCTDTKTQLCIRFKSRKLSRSF